MRDFVIFNFIQEITKPLFVWRFASAKMYKYEHSTRSTRMFGSSMTENQYYAECRLVSKAEADIEAAIKKFADQRGWTLEDRLIKPRLRKAYHLGFVSGKSKAIHRMSDEPYLSLNEENPYE